MADEHIIQPDDTDDARNPSENIGRKLVVALRSVNDPQAIMQATADRAVLTLRNELVTKIDAVEKAIAVAHDDLVRVPTDVQKAISALNEVIEAKLTTLQQADSHSALQREIISEHIGEVNNGLKLLHETKIAALTEAMTVFKQTVNERFQLGDIQTEKAARDVKSAVDAAFAAAKEAVGEQNKSNALSITKSESAFTKQIDQLADSVKSIVKNTDDKIGDIKERLLAIEGRNSVSDPTTTRELHELSTNVTRLLAGYNMGEGKTQKTDEVWKFVTVVIGLAGVLIAAMVMFAEHAPVSVH